jgi:hypothetical protein
MIMVESLLYQFRSRRGGDLCHIIIVDIDCDRSRRQSFRSDRCVTALRKLAHNISTDIFIGHLLLTVPQGDRETMPKRIRHTRPSDYIKSFVATSRHHKRSTARFNQLFIIALRRLQFMGSDHVCSCAVIQDDNIPNNLIPAILPQMSLGILLTPTLQ